MPRIKSKRVILSGLLAAGAALLLVAGAACSQKPSNQQIQGLVQGIDGGKAVITLDDGAKVSVEIDKSAEAVKEMVGEDVKGIVELGDDKKASKLIEVEKKGADDVVPEDLHFSGAVESKGADTWMIGGKSFKVNAATMLDQGLTVGVMADVEFMVLSDGSMLATKIETPADDDVVAEAGGAGQIGEDYSLTGIIGSMAADSIVIAGKTFKKDANTFMDNGLAVGVLARVQFVTKPDGSLLALEVETDAPDSLVDEDMFAEGPIQSIDANSVVIDGRTFKIEPATILDTGLKAGVMAKVEFVVKPDGTMVAKQVETATEGIDHGVNLYFAGPIQSISATGYTIGGKTFKLTATTKIDTGLVIGAIAEVQFVIQPDGSMTAIEIETSGLEFIGTLQAMAPDSYVVGGRIFGLNPAMMIERGLKVKKLVRVNFVIQPNGSLLALEIRAANTNVAGFSFDGVVQSKTATSIVVSTRTFQINATTVVASGVTVGTQVTVRFDVQAGGTMAALVVQQKAAARK